MCTGQEQMLQAWHLAALGWFWLRNVGAGSRHRAIFIPGLGISERSSEQRICSSWGNIPRPELPRLLTHAPPPPPPFVPEQSPRWDWIGLCVQQWDIGGLLREIATCMS